MGIHHIGSACLVGTHHICAAQWAPSTLVLPSGYPSHWCCPVGTRHIGDAQRVPITLVLPSGHPSHGAAHWAPITEVLPSSGNPSHWYSPVGRQPSHWCCSVGTHHIGAAQWALITLVLLITGNPSHWCCSVGTHHTRARALVLTLALCLGRVQCTQGLTLLS